MTAGQIDVHPGKHIYLYAYLHTYIHTCIGESAIVVDYDIEALVLDEAGRTLVERRKHGQKMSVLYCIVDLSF